MNERIRKKKIDCNPGDEKTGKNRLQLLYNAAEYRHEIQAK